MPVTCGRLFEFGAYVAKQKILRTRRSRWSFELEPLFECNLGVHRLCQDPETARTCSRADAGSSRRFAAIADSGAPMVSIAGGEP